MMYLEGEKEKNMRDPVARAQQLERENATLRASVDAVNQRNLELEQRMETVVANALRDTHEELLKERKLRQKAQQQYSSLAGTYSKLCGVVNLQSQSLDKLQGPQIKKLPPLRKTRST